MRRRSAAEGEKEGGFRRRVDLSASSHHHGRSHRLDETVAGLCYAAWAQSSSDGGLSLRTRMQEKSFCLEPRSILLFRYPAGRSLLPLPIPAFARSCCLGLLYVFDGASYFFLARSCLKCSSCTCVPKQKSADDWPSLLANGMQRRMMTKIPRGPLFQSRGEGRHAAGLSLTGYQDISQWNSAAAKEAQRPPTTNNEQSSGIVPSP